MSKRIAVVTGGIGGLGTQICKALAQAGRTVIAVDLDSRSERVSAFQQEVEGLDIHFAAANVGDYDACGALVQSIEAKYGALDILVNNAGIQHVASVEEFPVERWDSIIAINLSSVFHSTRLTLPGMRKRGWGRIVNIASVHGLVGSVGKAAYVAAKHGVIGLTKVVGLETATSNITCNAICPGWVLTPLVQKQIDQRISQGIDPYQAQHDLLAEKQPSLEFVTPPQLGELVLFLCSEAGSQVRGAAWNVDGGWLAQ